MGVHHDRFKRHAPLNPAVLDPGEKGATGNKPRLYLHIDMDAFFAAVEMRDNPDLRGKPVAVGGGPGNRGVVTTASYEARKFGVKSGMPAMEAKRRCPQIIFLPVNGSKYTYVSALIMKLLENFSPSVRPLSVDEASLDVTGTQRLFGSPASLGQRIKSEIQRRFHLPCSIGIGPNRLVAKMAANLSKPDGLLQLTQKEAERTFAELPVDKMIGIGKSTAQALEQLGIITLGDLAKCPDYTLKNRFGILGPVLSQMARGEWAGRMKQDDEREHEEKSIGHQRTFGKDIADEKDLKARLVGLSEMVARRVRRARFVGEVLRLKIRTTDFKTPHHQMKLPQPTDDEAVIIEYSWKLFQEIWIPGTPLRLLGLSLATLSPKEEWSGQLDLFYSKTKQRACDLYEAMDNLRDRFGERIIARAMGGRFGEKSRRGSISEIATFRQEQKGAGK